MKHVEVHRLLKRQLKKYSHIQEWQKSNEFLKQVNEAYKDFDKDLEHLENILEKSSVELFKANKSLVRERDLTRNQLEYLVKNVDVVIFQTDNNGRYNYLSPAWNKITGLQIKDSLGKHYSDFLQGKNANEKSSLLKLLNFNKNTSQGVFKYINNQNETLWIELTVALVFNENNNMVGSIGTFTNVTPLKKTEIALNKANRAKDDFLSTMSHDMRTPLNSIIGLSNMLLMEEHLPKQYDNLSALKYSAEHLLELINGVLDFDKIQSNKVEFDKKEFSLNHLIENYLGNFKFQSESKGLEFSITKQPDVPNILIGDSVRLSQIINNLLGNALKFTDKGAIKLAIQKVKSENNQIELAFSISDTGIGIPKEKQEVIFDKFVQDDLNTDRKHKGSGLGLAICKNLLNSQKSNIFVESELGVGTTFTFNLKFEVPVLKNIILKPKIDQLKSVYDNLELKVLVAEDNKINILVIKKFLSKWNVTYDISENGVEALNKLEGKDYDMILMDLEMPIMNGYETTKAIRKLKNLKKSNIPIIAFSASTKYETIKKAKQTGLNDFISKPFEPNELYSILKKHQPIQNYRGQ